MEMYAADHPNQWTFVKGGEDVLTEPQRLAAWESVYMGKAKEAFMPKIPLAAILKRTQEIANAVGVLQKAAKSD